MRFARLATFFIACFLARPCGAQTFPKAEPVSYQNTAVSVFLNNVSKTQQTPLKAKPIIEDYRITVFAPKQNADGIRENLAYLFDHGDVPSGFYWSNPQPGEPAFVLRRTESSIRREAQMPEKIRQQATAWVSELRDALTLTGKTREQAAARSETGWFGISEEDRHSMDMEGLAALNQDEWQQVRNGQPVTLPLNRLPAPLALQFDSDIKRSYEAQLKS